MAVNMADICQQFRRYIPKLMTEKLAFFFGIIMITSMLVFELTVILPITFHDRPITIMYYIHIFNAFFFFINMMGNFVLSITTDTTSGSTVLPAIMKPGWRLCTACESVAPPRSYHCPTCDRCILKRDHHCVFTGRCVGYKNQRYFLLFLFHTVVGGVYSNAMNLGYVWNLLGGFSVTTIVTLLLPMFAFVVGVARPYVIIPSFMSSTGVFGTLLLGALLGYHMINVLNGQITHERTRRIKDYDLGWIENFKHVFGIRWYLAVLWPFVESPLPGDGINFTCKNGTIDETTKDL